LPGFNDQSAELIDGAREDLISRPHVNRKAFAGEGAGIDGGSAFDDDAINWKACSGLDDNAVADLELAGQNAHFLAVAQQPAAARKYLDDFPNGPLRAIESDTFEAFPDHADEDDFGGDEGFAKENGGDTSDGEGQVRADLPFEETFQGRVEDAGTTKHCRQ